MKTTQLATLLLATGMATSMAQQPRQFELAKTDAQPVAAVSYLAKSPSSHYGAKFQPIEKVSVLQTVPLAKGLRMEVVRNEKGLLYKRFVEDGRIAGKDRLRNDTGLRANSSASSGNTFFESFESYKEEYGYDWIPDGWTEINQPDNIPTPEQVAKYVNNTWLVYESGGMYLPATTDGQYEAFCHFSYDRYDYSVDPAVLEQAAVAQDEWLITPSMTLKENDNLYFNAAIDYFGCYDTSSEAFDWNTLDFIERRIVNTMKVMVSPDDGITWEEVLDIAEEYTQDMSASELWDVGEIIYRPYKVDLSPYKGKTVKIAFRYVRDAGNMNGNSMCLDAVLVGTPKPVALYNRPSGSFMRGFSKDYALAAGYAVLAPAYVENKWRNYSESADSYSWKFADPDNPDADIILSDAEPSIAYPFGSVAMPALTASAEGAEDDTYQWGGSDDFGLLRSGGNNTVLFYGKEQPTTLGSGNYDLQRRFTVSQFQSGAYCFGTGSSSFWNAEIDAVCNYFEKPVSKYFITEMWIQIGVLDADPDAEFELIIHKVEDGTVTEDVIARASCRADEAEITAIQGEDYYSLPFKFYRMDEQSNEQVETYVEIEDAVLVELTGIRSEKVRKFAPFNQYEASPTKESNAYFYAWVTDEDNPENSGRSRLYAASETLKDFYSSFLFNMDATFNFFVPDSDRFNAPDEGGSKSISINTLYPPVNGAWWVDEEELAAMEDWVQPAFVPAEEGGYHRLVITAAALPQGVNSRLATFTLRTFGAEHTFTVAQGEAGVRAMESKPVRVARTGTSLSLLYPEGLASVTLYRSDGRAVATYGLPATGKHIIDISTLETGLYLLRFSDNTVVKFVR